MTMFWQEDDKKDDVSTSDKVIDVSYKIDCKQIPTSHATELAAALYAALPWLQDETDAAIQQIHGATSGNGWERPADGELIHLSRRTRMQLRLPITRVEDARQLCGKQLDIAGHIVTVGQMTTRPINPLATIFSRYIVVPEGFDESRFLQWVVEQLAQRDIRAKKLLCGMGHEIEVNDERLETRSLMIADLDKASSVVIQEAGLGPHRHHGCGIFIPHKGIKAVGETEDKSHFSGG